MITLRVQAMFMLFATHFKETFDCLITSRSYRGFTFHTEELKLSDTDCRECAWDRQRNRSETIFATKSRATLIRSIAKLLKIHQICVVIWDKGNQQIYYADNKNAMTQNLIS